MLPAQRAGSRRVEQQRPMQSLCAEHRARASTSCRGHRGVQHCCSRHHEGHLWMALAAGGARQCTLFRMRGMCARWCGSPATGS